MKWHKLLYTLVFANSLVMADELKMEDFAYAYELTLDKNGPIYELDVPYPVYDTLVSNSNGDLRIYNSDGISVPYTLKHEKTVIREKVEDIIIPIFPLYSGDSRNSNGETPSLVHIQRNDLGSITLIGPGKNVKQDATVSSYILDVSQLDEKPQSLLLSWADDQGDFNETISIRGSNDLANWYQLTHSAPVTNLHFGGHHIINNKVTVGKHNYKYLLARWSGINELSLSSVTGQYDEQSRDADRHRVKASGIYNPEEKHFDFVFPGKYPTDKLSVTFDQKNTVLLATLSSSDNQDGPWQHRYTGLFYNLDKNGKPVLPQDISLPRIVNDQYWRLSLPGDRDGIESMKPVLQSGSLAHKLVFIAQGNPPFKLVYGHSEAGPQNDSAIQQLLSKQDENDKNGSAQLGKPISLRGETALQVAVDNTSKWKAIILWSVLVLGLLALLSMVIRLYKQMDSGK